ncbi:hypothetical protein MLD52_16685 [Puniceicoccaceae bacterium K14]|nr:hypothetical protein [Puniceicoccaceae bacterium K14]
MNINTNLNSWDWVVICFYFAFIIGIGFLFRRINRNSSDYFRGGGNMLWWIAGMSAIISSISTWSFTAASAKVYQSGFLLPLTWLIGGLISVSILWFMAPRFRQMRVITTIEAVAQRFGVGTEQFFVYLILPMGLFWGGVGANAAAVFFAGALGINVPITLIGIVSIVTIMSLFGGQWAVAASDFVQGLLMFLTVLVVVFFTLRLSDIGGISNLKNVLPDRHFDFTLDLRPSILIMWILVMQMSNAFQTLNLNGEGGKYLLVKDGKQARGTIAMRFMITIIPITLIMQLPAMCAANIIPDMSAIFPDMKIPEEGAFLAMAFLTLPQGMMGLLICGMFAAAMSSMDSALNRNAGYFVRNVYIKYISTEATESKQLFMGRIFTLVFGFITLIIGLAFNELRSMNLFEIFQVLNSMVLVPSITPIALGVIYKRTPGWSGWSTVLVGLLAGALAKASLSDSLLENLFGGGSPLNKLEASDAEFIYISVIVFAVSIAWFFFTSVFYEKTSPDYRKQVDHFFEKMNTPIDHEKEDVIDHDEMQYRTVGIICLIFGTFALLGMLIPNPIEGRLCFLFVGGIIFGIGAMLYRIYLKKRKSLPTGLYE